MDCPVCSEANADDLVECGRCGALLVQVFGESGDDVSLAPGVSPPGQLQPGSLFAGRYEILELLGEGGMGTVYKARDRELDKLIALKAVRDDRVADPQAVLRFKQELLLARKVTHKNVVRIHDLGEAEGTKFFTMELIEGESLRDRIRQRGTLPIEEALSVAGQILAALGEAHQQGVVHRDLKPQNVMVDREGKVHVMDFGVARATDSDSLTATGAVMGTPDYMSPEQVRGEKAGPPSDLFAFGVMLYEMLTGALPYQAETAVSKLVMRLTAKVRSPREKRADVPLYLERVVLRCLEVDCALRYRSAGEIELDLRDEQARSTVALRVKRAAARHRVAIAAGVFLVAAVALYLGRRSPTSVEIEPPAVSVAILPFTNAAGSARLEWMRLGIPEMLGTDLGQSRWVRPVPGARLIRVLRDLGIAEQARFDEGVLKSISELTRAHWTLFGQFLESEGRLRLDLTLRKGIAGVPVPIKVEVPSARVFELVDELTRRVKSELDLTPEQIKGDVDRPVSEVTTASYTALEAYQRGLAELQRGAIQEAIVFLKEATSQDPDFAAGHARLADAYLGAGERRRAESSIERARQLAQTSPLPLAERYLIHATAASVKNDPETAAESYRELARLYPEDPDILLSLARAHEEAADLAQAAEAYEKVLLLAPEYGAALMGKGRVLVMSGRPAEAIDSLKRALESRQFAGQDEALGMLHSILGVALRETSDIEGALEHLNLSLDYRRRSGDRRGEAAALWNLAALYEDRGDLERALEAQQATLLIAREMGDTERESNALHGMGMTYMLAGDIEGALAAHRESLQIELERKDPLNLANRLNQVAQIYKIKGQFVDAAVYLDQAKSHLAASGDKQEAAINLNYRGELWEAQGRYAEAVQALLGALHGFQEIGQDLGGAIVRQNLATVYRCQGRFTDALTALGEGLAIYEQRSATMDQAEVLVARGHLLAMLGDLEAAEEDLARAEHLTGSRKGLRPQLLLARGEAARAGGRLTQAVGLFDGARVEAADAGNREVEWFARVALGEAFLESGRMAEARRGLEALGRTLDAVRHRPLGARVTVARASVALARGEFEEAVRLALAAAEQAGRFEGLPVSFPAYATAAEALERQGKRVESLDAYGRAAQAAAGIYARLSDRNRATFVTHHQWAPLLRRTSASLLKGGKEADARPLQEWIALRSIGSPMS